MVVQTVEQVMADFRESLKHQEAKARNFIEDFKASENIEGDIGNKIKGEVIDQAVLALRHIEDARMRFGKVIQYNGDGVSKFDK